MFLEHGFLTTSEGGIGALALDLQVCFWIRQVVVCDKREASIVAVAECCGYSGLYATTAWLILLVQAAITVETPDLRHGLLPCRAAVVHIELLRALQAPR